MILSQALLATIVYFTISEDAILFVQRLQPYQPSENFTDVQTRIQGFKVLVRVVYPHLRD